MLDFGMGLKLLAALAAAGWLAWMVFHQRWSRLHIMWAVFCAGLVAIMAIEVFGRQAVGPAYPFLAIISCASCSFFWLTSRELFRHKPALGWPEMALVFGIFLPTIFDQIALATGFGAVIGEAALASTMERLDGLQTLFSSAALVLAFGEGLNGWSGISDQEKRIRYIFLSSFGAGVGICVMLFDHGRLELISPGVTMAIQGICAAGIMVTASIAIIHRQGHPLPAGSTRKAPPASEEEITLAKRAETLVAGGAYLDPDLKVATLARRLNEKDYRLSRAIVAGLNQSNFNRFVNKFRIQHAKQLLADPEHSRRGILNVALDSGFASLGPFNRAFKEATGLTPREYREQQKAAARTGNGLSSNEVFAE
ncbi:AraC family transcriptional regulator [Hyphobacterium sp. HN65]|uniref:AraC family transcriptional regulator n=1 Tax=Hyphobacterium lacteum TaxID=3116575 RepID=A0ABU7LMI8_9PROT|nr:AraC family transcriptional regulator [Hyphobacterium sp. HN65]MEE2525143.1 AraC family transcriptional regulator [Hyphobacterium sp. HN65]